MNCMECADEDNVCTTCAEGFIVEDGECVEEPIICEVEKCEECAMMDNVCTTCADGYIVKQGACEKRPIMCQV